MKYRPLIIPSRVAICPQLLLVFSSDIPVRETETDTEMIDISKTHTETNTGKIVNE